MRWEGEYMHLFGAERREFREVGSETEKQEPERRD
jgi:hypothetical protein